MSTDTSLTFTLGETWEIPFALNDADGVDLDLTDAAVAFRVSRRGVLMLALTTAGADVSVDSPSHGVGAITVPPDEQADLYAAVYDYEVRATLQDGRVTTQAAGALTVQKTLFAA